MNAKGSDNFLQAMIFKFEGGWSHVWCQILLEINELSSILPTLTTVLIFEMQYLI